MRDSVVMGEPNEWYWDLQKGVAVTGDQRGHGDHMLGPYPTRGQAENWKKTVESRNETWDDADERWNGDEPADD